jgi:hypothetical protein
MVTTVSLSKGFLIHMGRGREFETIVIGCVFFSEKNLSGDLIYQSKPSHTLSLRLKLYDAES